MNANDVFNRTKKIFGDLAGVQLGQNDIISWINDAQREIATQHDDLLRTTTTFASVAGQSSYKLPTNFLNLVVLSFDLFGEYKVLSNVSPRDFEKRFKAHPNYSDYPIVFSRGENSGYVEVFPAPVASVNDYFKLIYTRYPQTITSLADDLEIPQYYHNTVLDFCLMKAYEMDENLEMYQMKFSQINQQIERYIQNEAWFDRSSYPVIQESEY